jgi:hypothetical protein
MSAGSTEFSYNNELWTPTQHNSKARSQKYMHTQGGSDFSELAEENLL